MSDPLPVFVDSPPCSCHECQSYCSRPCWPIPSEIVPLIKAGKGSRLMLDWWEGDFHDGEHDRVYIICPANPGYEGKAAPEVSFFSFWSSGGGDLKSGCTFLRRGLCALHDRGLKPTEGRVAHHERSHTSLHGDVARTWDTEEGRTVVADWCATRGLADPYLEDDDEYESAGGAA